MVHTWQEKPTEPGLYWAAGQDGLTVAYWAGPNYECGCPRDYVVTIGRDDEIGLESFTRFMRIDEAGVP